VLLCCCVVKLISGNGDYIIAYHIPYYAQMYGRGTDLVWYGGELGR